MKLVSWLGAISLKITFLINWMVCKTKTIWEAANTLVNEA